MALFGRVEAPIERQGFVAIELFDFVPPADHRPAVGMIEIERGVHLFAEPGARIVGDPHILLFEHDIELGPHHVVGEHQSGDAVGLERHHLLEMLARHALEKAGVVAGGEGVLLAADFVDILRERGAGILFGALEHQMFEEMRETGFPGRLVGGADLVPDHVGDDRSAMIGHHDDFEPVRQSEMADIRTAAGKGFVQVRSAGERAGQYGCKHQYFRQVITSASILRVLDIVRTLHSRSGPIPVPTGPWRMA